MPWAGRPGSSGTSVGGRAGGRGPGGAGVGRGRPAREHQVADPVDPGGEAGVDGDGRAELLDDRRAVEGVAGAQVRSPQDRRLDVALVRVEADRPDVGLCAITAAGTARTA